MVGSSLRKRTSQRYGTTDTSTGLGTNGMLCQLNHAGASPSPQIVLDRVQQHIELEQRIGGYAAADVVSNEIDGIYQHIANLIHAKSAREIALTESATVAWTRAFYAMAEKQLREQREHRDVILICDAEYAANVVAACQWARTHRWTVLSIPSSTQIMGSGMVDVQVLERMLAGGYEYTDPIDGTKVMLDPARIAIACITQVPTNSGIVNPVEKIGSLITHYNSGNENQSPIYYLVDACQAVGQLEVNVEDIQCHALVSTGRKYLRGPRGTGFLYVASNLLESLIPSHVDHFGVPIRKVPSSYIDGDAIQDLLEFTPRSDARRFEFWESSAASRLGFGKAVEYALEISLTKIQHDCASLSRYLRNRLTSISNIHVHHEGSSSCGIVTFYSAAMESSSLKETLQDRGFELSLVPATSTPLDSAKTTVPDLVRASISYTNTQAEIDEFIESLLSVFPSSTSAEESMATTRH